eukprot:m.562306 g.562306  ORF g.562306 m.562306 type:complete len:513 (+) comp22221_c0_seq11:163-1701(+)
MSTSNNGFTYLIVGLLLIVGMSGSYYVGYFNAPTNRDDTGPVAWNVQFKNAEADADDDAEETVEDTPAAPNESIEQKNVRESSKSSKSSTRRKVQLAVVTHLDEPTRYMAQFLNLVYPSWKWVTSHQASIYSRMQRPNTDSHKHPIYKTKDTDSDPRHLPPADVLADLVVFVDVNLSHLLAIMPPECRLLPSTQKDVPALTVEERFSAGPHCYFVVVNPKSADNKKRHLTHTYDKYRFMQSISFLGSAEFDVIVQDSGWYDFFMRIDTDCLLAPGLLSWAPLHGQAAFGGGFMGFPSVTNPWIREFALKHGFRSNMSSGVRGGQSTTYVPTGAPGKEWAKTFINATGLVRMRGFLKQDCVAREKHQVWIDLLKSGTQVLTKPCAWPWWYNGVATLYGQLIAMNHVFGENVVRTAQLDYPMGQIESDDAQLDVVDVVALHLLTAKHRMDELMQDCNELNYQNESAVTLDDEQSKGSVHADTEPDQTSWEAYVMWFFTRARARSCAASTRLTRP